MKIAIVGAAGGIGSSLAYTLTIRGVGSEYLLVDPNKALLETHVMDIEQLRMARPFVIRAGEPDEIPSADVVVISASVPPEPDLPRMDYLRRNLAITRGVADVFVDRDDWKGCVVIASNPVDPLLFDFQRRTGIARKRVLGYTINDTLRFRSGIANVLDVAPNRVTAWAIGEHGNYCVPLFSRVTVDGAPRYLDAQQRDQVTDYLFGWYPHWVSLGTHRTSTWTSGDGLARMVEALLAGNGDPWPTSFVLAGEYELSDVALSVPAILGPSGVEMTLDWTLDESEREGMTKAAEYLNEINLTTV